MWSDLVAIVDDLDLLSGVNTTNNLQYFEDFNNVTSSQSVFIDKRMHKLH